MIFTIIHPKGNVESCTITIISPQEEFLQASDLAGAILDHREKEGNLVFFQQVLSFASNEHKKGVGSGKSALDTACQNPLGTSGRRQVSMQTRRPHARQAKDQNIQI